MRIISGKYGGRRFSPPKNFKARPTTDSAKENLFNVLHNFIDWENTKALDLFGGTGAISLELASRGCPTVVCIENDRIHADFILQTKNTLKADELTVLRTSVFKYLEHSKQSFDLIFADPPYDMGDDKFQELALIILEGDFIANGGLFILEHPENMDFSHLPHFDKKRKYGRVNFSFFEKG